MNNKTSGRIMIVIGVFAVAVIAGNVLDWYLGDLAKDPNVIFWMRVAMCGLALITCSIVGVGMYLDHKTVRDRTAYLKSFESSTRDDTSEGK
jgi:hypothetical protein